MGKTIKQGRAATPAHRTRSHPDTEPVIAITPALGPIPAIPVTAGTFPSVDLRHALVGLLEGMRLALTREHHPAG